MEFLKKNKKALIMLAIALCVILVSSFCASMIQADAYRVKVTDLRNVTNGEGDTAGEIVSGIMFVPKTATKENPAPGIVLTHGYLNNRELQLQNAIELARRGFVVVTIDRGQHGNNQTDIGTGSLMNTNGLYESAKYLYNLEYVDQSRIGISGHSMGGYTTSWTLAKDNADLGGLGIISAGLMQGWDSFLGAGEGVSVGILKAKDDEFFFGSTSWAYPLFNGSKNTDIDGNDVLSRQYLQSVAAAKFVGYEYTTSIDIKSGDLYVDGSVIEKPALGTAATAGFRVIYEADEIHPQNHFSTESASYVVDFFYNAFGTPAGHNVIKTTSQTWWLKETFSFIGLIAVFFMILPLVSILITVPGFKSLAKSEEVDLDADLLSFKQGGVANIVRTVLFWLSGVATMIFGGFILQKAYAQWGTAFFPISTLLPQNTTGSVATWSVISALFGLAVMLFVWLVNAIINEIAAKKGKETVAVTNPFRPASIGIINFVKTVFIAVVVVVVFYAVTWINWAIWTVDFRIWTLNVHPFRLNMLGAMARYIPMFLMFYLVSALGNAGMRARELPEWASILINVVFNSFGVLLVILIQYGTFRSTGELWQRDMNLGYIVVMPLVAVLAIATVISRYTYKKTGNVWLGAFINAILFTIMTVANTAHQYPYI